MVTKRILWPNKKFHLSESSVPATKPGSVVHITLSWAEGLNHELCINVQPEVNPVDYILWQVQQCCDSILTFIFKCQRWSGCCRGERGWKCIWSGVTNRRGQAILFSWISEEMWWMTPTLMCRNWYKTPLRQSELQQQAFKDTRCLCLSTNATKDRKHPSDSPSLPHGKLIVSSSCLL